MKDFEVNIHEWAFGAEVVLGPILQGAGVGELCIACWPTGVVNEVMLSYGVEGQSTREMEASASRGCCRGMRKTGNGAGWKAI